MLKHKHIVLGFIASLGLLSTPALAQAPMDTDNGEATGNPSTAGDSAGPTEVGAPAPLAEAKSDDDPTPEAAPVLSPSGGIVKQAGIGGSVAYGRHGVLELGGSAGFTAATDYRQLSISPSIGWFLADNFEVSAIFSLINAKQGSNTQTLFTGVLEPSYHIPFTNSVFGFVGLGAGLGYVDGPGAGFALAPRAGANILVGRSGVLTPAAFFQYTTHEATQTRDGALLAVSAAYGLQLGYTVMW